MRNDNPFQIGTIVEVIYDGKTYDMPEDQYFKIKELWRGIDIILTKYERKVDK